MGRDVLQSVSRPYPSCFLRLSSLGLRLTRDSAKVPNPLCDPWAALFRPSDYLQVSYRRRHLSDLRVVRHPRLLAGTAHKCLGLDEARAVCWEVAYPLDTCTQAVFPSLIFLERGHAAPSQRCGDLALTSREVGRKTTGTGARPALDPLWTPLRLCASRSRASRAHSRIPQ